MSVLVIGESKLIISQDYGYKFYWFLLNFKVIEGSFQLHGAMEI